VLQKLADFVRFFHIDIVIDIIGLFNIIIRETPS
jgi:hypothetical protein